MIPAPVGWAGDLDVRTPSATAYVDLGAGEETFSGDALVSYRLDRELTGDLPEQVRGQAGLSAASLDLVLALPDEEVTSRGWSPWRRALRPGGRVRLTLGWGGVEVQKFTGVVLKITAPAGSATMSVSCIDDTIAAQDSTALVMPLIPGAETDFGMFSGSWPLSTLAFGAGYRNVPPVGAGCVIALPFQGGIRPERVAGDVNWPATLIANYASAPFEARGGVEFLTVQRNYSVDRLEAATGDKYGPQRGAVVSAALSAFGSVTLNDAASRWFRLRRTSTVTEAVFATTVAGLDSAPISLGSVNTSALDFNTPVYAQVVLSHNTVTGSCSYTLTVRGVGSSSGSAAVGAGAWYWTALWANRVTGSTQRVAGVQVLDGTAGAVDLDAWEPTFHTTGSSVDIAAVPYIPERVRWPLMGEIAASELGALAIDETGVLRFRNHSSMVDAAPVAEITSQQSIAHLAWSSSLDALRARVTVDWRPVRVEGFSPVVSPIYTFSLRMDGDTTEDVWIDLPAEVYELVTPVPEPNVTAPIDKGEFKVYSSSDTDVTASWAATGEVRVTLLSPVRAKMRIVNPGGGPWRMEGNIAGRYRTWFDDPDVVIQETGAEQAYDIRTELTLDSSPWRQDRPTAAQIASWLAADVGSPRPILSDVGIIPNPLLQLADVVTVRDPIVTDLYMRCLITAEQLEGGPGHMAHRLSLRELGWRVSDFDARYSGKTLAQFDAEWAGKTLADFDREFTPGA